MNTALKTRPAAVAGSFYPASPAELAQDVAALLRAAAPGRVVAAPKALIVPHAGYVYSGPVAACAYASLAAARRSIQRVVLLGPSHRVALSGLALPLASGFTTPLGTVALDTTLARALLDLPQVRQNDAAHALEHSLEVQLPFLQTALESFSLLPLAVGDATTQEVTEVIERVWGGPETLIVVSSDLSHYHAYAEAQRLDRATAGQILALVQLSDFNQACGAIPVNALIDCARRHGLVPRLLALRNSGDSEAGDRVRVVGYGAFAFDAAIDDETK